MFSSVLCCPQPKDIQFTVRGLNKLENVHIKKAKITVEHSFIKKYRFDMKTVDYQLK